MSKPTKEQQAAIDSRGKVIVSASAGSGKTFVMIQKLVGAIERGADLDEVLAVTFTKKAAAQMKEKLRSELIKRMENSDDEKKARLKVQLSKIASADISTIHSLCARLLRTYFYVLDIDGGFDIISADDAVATGLQSRAMEAVFEKNYEENSPQFKLLLNCLTRKRTDKSLKGFILEAYKNVRSTAHYDILLEKTQNLYTEGGFKYVCEEYFKPVLKQLDRMICAVQSFRDGFKISKNADKYSAIFSEMTAALTVCKEKGLFGEKPPLYVTSKPAKSVKKDSAEDLAASDEFDKFKKSLKARYDKICNGFKDERTELDYFLKSGKLAAAFSDILMQFDREYAEVKRDENKLDYNDLEHLTLKLLEDQSVKNEISSKYKYVFVDEYQDVNPVQEEIISALGEEVFLVGDVKQAIYGFRGSKSEFFSQKYAAFSGEGEKSALKLSNNFRSSDEVLNFVNGLFSDIMQPEVSGIDYSTDGVMLAGGGYKNGYGQAKLHIFGKDEKEEKELKVYSVAEDGRQTRHTREGLAILSLVKSELSKQHYDLQTGEFVDTQCGDICILTRKSTKNATDGIVRALRDGGYAVSTGKEFNICTLPEVKQFLDILSLIDNAEQDIPLVSALLSPLGGMCEDELAAIRIFFKDKKDKKNLSFRECCREYAAKILGEISQKLNIFGGKLQKLRALSELVTTGELADEILENYGLETAYGVGGGEKLKNVLKLIAEGTNLSLAAFLQKIKDGGYDVSAPASAPSESIKVMTMHSAKGLEFPVVIIADICRSFKGMENGEILFDDKFGFALKYYDFENMLTHDTVLQRLCKQRSDAEELKNEINLFYVACTRAMCNLHVLAKEVKLYDPEKIYGAETYAEMFDLNKFTPEELPYEGEISAQGEEETIVYKPDGELVEQIEKRFMAKYSHADSVDLPVKSSASAILKQQETEPLYALHELFGGEGETGTERGTAYHRFLELCDFKLKSKKEIQKQIDNFYNSGRISKEQKELLNAEELEQILNMPVFENLGEAVLYREQEFLCRLPANEILPEVTASDGVLVQGAIDLLARGDFGVKIIDYKYSHKTDEQLVATYARQLDLYKKAVSVITGTAAEKISCTIINIFKKRQIDL